MANIIETFHQSVPSRWPAQNFYCFIVSISYRALQGLDDQSERQDPELEKKAKQAGFLQTKAKEYRKNADSLKASIIQHLSRSVWLRWQFLRLLLLSKKLYPARNGIWKCSSFSFQRDVSASNVDPSIYHSALLKFSEVRRFEFENTSSFIKADSSWEQLREFSNVQVFFSHLFKSVDDNRCNTGTKRREGKATRRQSETGFLPCTAACEYLMQSSIVNYK